MNLNLAISLGFITAQIALSPEAVAADASTREQINALAALNEYQRVDVMATSPKWSAL